MATTPLKVIQFSQDSKEKKQYGEFNGQPIELNIRCNFRPHEFNAVYDGKKFIKDLQSIDVSYFEKKFDSLSKNDRNYVRLLAIFRRLSLDFFTEISSPISIEHYKCIDSIENFKLFDEYFDKYYETFDPQYAKNDRVKNNFKKSAKLFTLKLWMDGYGLIPGLTDKYLTSEFLEEILKYAKKNRTRNVMKFLRFISFALSQENNSPIDKQIVIIEGSADVYDREIAKWDLIENEDNSELLNIFKDFSVNFYYKRTTGNLLHEYNNNGTLKRETYEQIGIATFVNYSIGLRNMLLGLEELEIFTLDEALKHGILDVLADKADLYKKTKYDNMKSATKALVDFYIKDNNLDLNIDKIVPPTLSRRDTSYGQTLNISDVSELIGALLDDNCSFYDEISLSDYRCRYICLMMLSTGQRISAHISLAYDCIKKNKNGDLFIHFHNTKGEKELTVPATPDILNYVAKLKAVAPLEELYFPRKKYRYLDDLKIRRLIANKFNSGPINRETVSDFLRRLQKHLWGEDLKNKDKVFAPHDFRRMKATYMSWCGASQGEIAKQLGQSNINSQLPYLQTKPVEHQEVFANIYEEGLYSNLYQIDTDGNILLDKNIIEDKANDISSTNSYDTLIESILSSINDADDITIQKVDSSTLEPTGFPVSIYGCNASDSVHCMKTRISCFSCDYYKPNDDSLESHKAEIFRYLLLHKKQLKSLKSTKDIMLKSILTEKTKFLEGAINDAFGKLFDKFNLNKNEISKVKEELETKSKTYSNSRTYGKQKPMPSFLEALRYIKEGKI